MSNNRFEKLTYPNNNPTEKENQLNYNAMILSAAYLAWRNKEISDEAYEIIKNAVMSAKKIDENITES